MGLTQPRTKLIMNRIILLSAFVAVCQAQYIAAPYGLSAPLTYGAASFGYRTAAAPVVTIKAAPVVTVKAAPTPVVTVNAAPTPVVTVNAAPAPVNQATSTQFHAQDEFGNFQYGYSNINSQKHETGNIHTGVSGSYSYTDAHGIGRTINYVADGLGFRHV